MKCRLPTERKNRVIPIEFVDTDGTGTFDANRNPSQLHQYIRPEILRIKEPLRYRQDVLNQLSGPSEEVVQQIAASFDLITQQDKRRVLSKRPLSSSPSSLFWRSCFGGSLRQIERKRKGKPPSHNRTNAQQEQAGDELLDTWTHGTDRRPPCRSTSVVVGTRCDRTRGTQAIATNRRRIESCAANRNSSIQVPSRCRVQQRREPHPNGLERTRCGQSLGCAGAETGGLDMQNNRPFGRAAFSNDAARIMTWEKDGTAHAGDWPHTQDARLERDEARTVGTGG